MAPVLVTGISGFVATHVALSLLKKGYEVRGTVRSESKADALKQLPDLAPYVKDGKLTFVVVEDVAKSDFTQALDGVEIVMHVASPFNTNFKDPKAFLDPAIDGTLNVLKAADKANVKNFVFTSSFAAIFDMGDKSAPLNSKSYSDKDWNPIDYDSATKTDNPTVAYCASKKLAEKAAYDYKKETGTSMKIASVNPPMIFGPIISPPAKTSALNESNGQIFNILTAKELPDTAFPAFSDVRDVADIHVAAAEKNAEGRFLAYGGPFDNDQVVDFARKHFPDQAKNAPKSKGTGLAENPKLFKLDVSRATGELGIKFRSFDETFGDMIKQLYEIADKESS